MLTRKCQQKSRLRPRKSKAFYFVKSVKEDWKNFPAVYFAKQFLKINVSVEESLALLKMDVQTTP